MKKILLLLTAVIVGGAFAPAMADPQSDLRQFQDFFKKKFPEVKLDAYSDGLYALPGFEAYRAQWESNMEFPGYEIGLERGRKLWKTPFKNGKTFASCFKNGGKNIAQGYPYWDEAKKEIRTAEMDIMDCAKKNGGDYPFMKADLTKDTKARVQLAERAAAVYELSRGQRVNIDLSAPGARAAYEDGKKFYWTRRGQLNFACNNCHIDLAGKNFGGGQPLSAGLGHPLGWPAQRVGGWDRVETIHQRYRTCNSQVRDKPDKHGAKVYNHLQLYETYMSSGLPLTAPTLRN